MNRKSRIENIAPARVAGKRRTRRVRETTKALFRKAILDAGEEVFASAGFYGAKVQDIAARAGVAVGTIYNHFGQKEDVLIALLRRIDSPLLSLRVSITSLSGCWQNGQRIPLVLYVLPETGWKRSLGGGILTCPSTPLL